MRQTRAVIENINIILEASGSSLINVASTSFWHSWLIWIELPRHNKVYAEYFTKLATTLTIAVKTYRDFVEFKSDYCRVMCQTIKNLCKDDWYLSVDFSQNRHMDGRYTLLRKFSLSVDAGGKSLVDHHNIVTLGCHRCSKAVIPAVTWSLDAANVLWTCQIITVDVPRRMILVHLNGVEVLRNESSFMQSFQTNPSSDFSALAVVDYCAERGVVNWFG